MCSLSGKIRIMCPLEVRLSRLVNSPLKRPGILSYDANPLGVQDVPGLLHVDPLGHGGKGELT